MIFTVEGKPVSQGSLVAIPTARDWRKRPGVRWTLKDAKASLKPWREAVADAAREAWGDQSLLEGPVRVWARFLFERPTAHFFVRKDGRVLRDDAPSLVTSHQLGDLDKHLRSILDALTGVVFRDDAQVAEVTAVKAYGVSPRCIVGVTPSPVSSIAPPNEA